MTFSYPLFQNEAFIELPGMLKSFCYKIANAVLRLQRKLCSFPPKFALSPPSQKAKE